MTRDMSGRGYLTGEGARADGATRVGAELLPADRKNQGESPGDGVPRPVGEGGADPRVEFSPNGRARLLELVDRRPGTDARGAALAFLRPDDPRFEDRVLDRAADGAHIAAARMRPDAAGEPVRYLWFVARERAGGLDLLARSVEVSPRDDGDDEVTAFLDEVDRDTRAWAERETARLSSGRIRTR